MVTLRGEIYRFAKVPGPDAEQQKMTARKHVPPSIRRPQTIVHQIGQLLGRMTNSIVL